MIPFKEEIDSIKNQIIDGYKPYKIILFGSCAAECARNSSDIDLCIICDYEDKQKLLMDLLLNIFNINIVKVVNLWKKDLIR